MVVKLFYQICIYGSLLALLPGCGEKEAPTEQVKYATVTGIVHYRYFSEVTLIEGAEIKIMDKVDTADIKGKYTIEGIPYGEHEITCTHPDYDTYLVILDLSREKYFFDIDMIKTTLHTLPAFSLPRCPSCNPVRPNEHSSPSFLGLALYSGQASRLLQSPQGC